MNLEELFEYRDGELFWKKAAPVRHTRLGRRAGTINKGYLFVKSKHLDGPPCQAVHRLIWMLHFGDIPPEAVIDHINRNTLDNRVENLRLATRSQNSMNAKGKSSSIAKLPKNVYVDWVYKDIVKYRAQVFANGSYHRVGNLDTIEEALSAAQDLRDKFHKEFQFVKD